MAALFILFYINKKKMALGCCVCKEKVFPLRRKMLMVGENSIM